MLPRRETNILKTLKKAFLYCLQLLLLKC